MEFESFLAVQCISPLRIWLKMSQITQLQWISKQVLWSCSKQIMEVSSYCSSTNILSSNIIHSLNGLHSVSAFAAWLLWSYTHWPLSARWITLTLYKWLTRLSLYIHSVCASSHLLLEPSLDWPMVKCPSASTPKISISISHSEHPGHYRTFLVKPYQIL